MVITHSEEPADTSVGESLSCRSQAPKRLHTKLAQPGRDLARREGPGSERGTGVSFQPAVLLVMGLELKAICGYAIV